MTKIFRTGLAAVLAAALLAVTGCAKKAQSSSSVKEEAVVEAGIKKISKYGNVELNVSPETMIEHGFEEADLITVEIGKQSVQLPIGTNYSDVDTGQGICRYDAEDDPPHITLALNGGNFASAMGIADKKEADNEAGYEWVYREGLDANTVITIRMAEKQGYANEYQIHKVTATRTNERRDYADLSDEEYANFRVISSSGMGKGTLYRSSSPINPKIGRSTQADEALSHYGIRTVINLADNETEMKAFADYSSSSYSACDILPLSMEMDMTTEDSRAKLAEAMRFIIAHEGPYLIHCLEGKDRTGFMAAILESLMGADLNEITADYMATYYNFYKVTEGTDSYDRIKAIIKDLLLNAFKISSISEEEALNTYAETYISELGLSQQEITELKARLSADHQQN